MIKKISISLLLLLIFFIGCENSTKSDSKKNLTIGALIPFSATGVIDGNAMKAALEIANENINKDKNINLEIIYRDTQYDILAMETAIAELKEMGVKIIISATTSDNLRILKDEVTEQELILIDITSTAAELAVADNVFRLVPNDNATALAINSNLVSNGIQKLAILYRNDIWGSNLSQTLKKDFESQGGEVIAFLDYDARLPEINMDDAIEELNSRITTALPTGAQIAVELFSYEEGIDILKKSSSFESLSKICWYGSDGLIKNQNLLQTPDAAEFAATVGIYCPTIGELSTSQFITIQEQIEDRLGYSFQTNAILMVDAVTIAVQALETAEDDINNLKNTIFEITENTEGITGDLRLNPSGDRIDCLYDFWGVVKTDTDYNWQKK